MTTKIPAELSSTPGIADSSNATAITIDSSERVMIGTTDAGYPDYGDSLTLGDVDGGGGNAGMTIRSGTSSYGTFYFSDATGTAAGAYAGKMQYNHSTNSMVFGTNGSDRLTIDSSGNVGIGTTSPAATLQVKTQTNGNLAFQNSTSVTGGVKLNCFNDAANASSPFEIDGSSLQFNIGSTEKMRIAANGNVGIGTTSPLTKLTVSGDYITQTDGTRTMYLGSDGTGGQFGTSTNHYLRFITNNTERMRIDSSGNMLIGTTTSNGKINIYYSSVFGQLLRYTGSANTVYPIIFEYGGATVGSISHTSSATSFNQSSDYRLKENIIYEWDAISKVKNLKPAQFNFKINTDETVEGFIAHEAQSVVPYAVVGEKDGEQLQGMDYGKLTPILVKAIQEQQDIIDDLKSRIETLEG